MGVSFFKKIIVGPVSLNVSRKGISVSIGPRGAKLNFGRRKILRIYAAGFRYVGSLGKAKGKKKRARRRALK
jgi:hypothetical protein